MNNLPAAELCYSGLFLIVVVLLTLEYLARRNQRFHEKSSGQNIMPEQEISTFSKVICLISCLIPFTLGFLIPVIILLNFVLVVCKLIL